MRIWVAEVFGLLLGMVKRRLEHVGGGYLSLWKGKARRLFWIVKETAVVMSLQFQVAGCKKIMGQRRSDVGFSFGLLP